MAKVMNTVLVRRLSGVVGNAIFRQMPDGSTWVSASPDFSRRKFSKGQKSHQRRFKEAAAHARQAAKTANLLNINSGLAALMFVPIRLGICVRSGIPEYGERQAPVIGKMKLIVRENHKLICNKAEL